MRGAHRGVWCSKGTLLMEAELFAAQSNRSAPDSRALTALQTTQGKFRVLQFYITETTHGTEPPFFPFSRECFAERPAKGQRGVKRGHRKPQVSYVPFCPRRGHGVSAARRRQCPACPSAAILASNGKPLYRRTVSRLLTVNALPCGGRPPERQNRSPSCSREGVKGRCPRRGLPATYKSQGLNTLSRGGTSRTAQRGRQAARRQRP